MHENDDVAIVANDLGLPAGAEIPGGLRLLERVPQGHKVALTDIARGSDIRRYNVVIGKASRDLPAGSWINEDRLDIPPARPVDDLPVGTRIDAPQVRLEGETFQGYRNADGSVGTRATSWPSPRPCNAYRASWNMPFAASGPSFCRAMTTSTACCRSSISTAAVSPSTRLKRIWIG